MHFMFANVAYSPWMHLLEDKWKQAVQKILTQQSLHLKKKRVVHMTCSDSKYFNQAVIFSSFPTYTDAIIEHRI